MNITKIAAGFGLAAITLTACGPSTPTAPSLAQKLGCADTYSVATVDPAFAEASAKIDKLLSITEHGNCAKAGIFTFTTDKARDQWVKVRESYEPTFANVAVPVNVGQNWAVAANAGTDPASIQHVLGGTITTPPPVPEPTVTPTGGGSAETAGRQAYTDCLSAGKVWDQDKQTCKR